jgi:hypothetical protein
VTYSEEELDLVLKERKPVRGSEESDEEYLKTLPNLAGVKLQGSFYDNTRLAGANLCNASFTGDFSDTDFSYAILANADLSFCNLQSSSFVRANLKEANLTHARAVYADFASAYLFYANMFNIIATACDFDLADLNNADMRRGRFVRARFVGAHLKEARLQNALLVGAHMPDANLKEAGLTGADLSGCDFTGANLEGAAIQGAIASYSTSFLGAVMPNGERYREREESPQETLHRYRVPEFDE